MTNQVQHWIEERIESDTTISYLQSWVNGDDGWEQYFSLLTTSSIPEGEIRGQQNEYHIICESHSLDVVEDYLPQDETSSIEPAEITETALSDAGYQSTRQADIRIERTSPSDQERWGTNRPTLRVEGWIEETDAPTCPTEVQKALNEEISEQSGFDLDKHPDYKGNILLVLEDQRVKLTTDERPQLEIEPDLLSTDSLFVTVEWREYGDLIWTQSVEFEDLVNFEISGGSDGSEGEIPLEIRTPSEEFTVDLTNIDDIDPMTLGASEIRISIINNGVSIDWTEVPLMRIITTNIQIGTSGTERESESGPPALYYDTPTDQPGMSIVVGRHLWDDRRIEFGSQQKSRGWCTDADEVTVAQALSSIQTEFGSVVKVVDPYIDDDHIISFVEELDQGTDVWGITSKPIDTQQLMSKFQSWESDGRNIEFLRLLDSNGSASGTPLHDRFILTGGNRLRGWVLGTSFNSLDTNVSIISELPQRVVNQLDRVFNSWWYDTADDQRGTDCRKSFEGTSDN